MWNELRRQNEKLKKAVFLAVCEAHKATECMLKKENHHRSGLPMEGTLISASMVSRGFVILSDRLLIENFGCLN